ncbi:MAG: hypothetical protein JKY53_12485 [Flavobacteriales bacterium]|nr:hypothetical protein [Flavobacteriales bacterium]
MRTTLFILTIIISTSCISQDKEKLKIFEKYEDSLATLRELTLHAKSDVKRAEFNQAFLSVFKSILSQDASYEFNFNDIPAIGDLRSPDNAFRMITWNMPLNNRTHKYFCLLQVHVKGSKDYALYELIDKSDEITRPLNRQLDHTKWFGALYSDIIVVKKKGKTYYTLLGWDGNDQFTTKKIIEVLYFTSSNKPKFGAQIFKLSKRSPRRIIFEYAEEVTMSLKWEEKRNQIVFDHLSPTEDDLKGVRMYYLPDMSFDALELQKGNWVYVSDVDIRIKKGKYDEHYNDPKQLKGSEK